MDIFNTFFKKINDLFKTYDMDTLHGIRSIPLDAEPIGDDSLLDAIDYRLYRKATEHKKNGNIALAIECLKKANAIQDSKEFFSTTQQEYMRLLKYMKSAGYAENIIEKERLRMEQKHPNFFGKSEFNSSLEHIMISLKKDPEDLDTVFVTTSSLCPTCSTYNRRIYSLHKNDKRFPALPDFLTQSQCPDCSTHIGFCIYFPFLYDEKRVQEDIEFSNRPFIRGFPAKTDQDS